MKYWLDTEFIARPFVIDLISIGLVAEDGREFYAESSEVDWSKAHAWTLENVRPQLDGKGINRENISYALRQFHRRRRAPGVLGLPSIGVAFVGLFGAFEELPFHFPPALPRQAIEHGDPELPHQKAGRRHALADARWTKDARAFLASHHPAAANRRAFGQKNPGQWTARQGGPTVPLFSF